MKTSTGRLFFPFIVFAAILLFLACGKEKSGSSASIPPSGTAKLSVYLTDGPYDFQQVLVDIQSVQVLVDTCHHFGDPDDQDDQHQGDSGDDHGDHHESDSACRFWSDLAINPGVYDLLQLRNGTDTLLGSGFVPNGKIVKIKVTLGTDNHVMADSAVYPLQIRDGLNFVIIKVKNEHLDSIAPGNFNLLMDFNLARSIWFENGVYYLRPQLRLFSEHHTGGIEGRVLPRGSYGLIRAANATDTAYALPDCFREGEFRIRGLKEGSYDVFVDGINGYSDTTITNVMVKNSSEAELGTITLHQ